MTRKSRTSWTSSLPITSPTERLDVKPSQWFRGWLVLLLIFYLWIIGQLAYYWVWPLVLLAPVGWYLYLLWQRHVVLTHPWSVIGFDHQQLNAQLFYRNGESVSAVISGPMVVNSFLVIVPFKWQGSRGIKRFYLVLFPDSAAPEQLHRLRVWLRTHTL